MTNTSQGAYWSCQSPSSVRQVQRAESQMESNPSMTLETAGELLENRKTKLEKPNHLSLHIPRQAYSLEDLDQLQCIRGSCGQKNHPTPKKQKACSFLAVKNSCIYTTSIILHCLETPKQCQTKGIYPSTVKHIKYLPFLHNIWQKSIKTPNIWHIGTTRETISLLVLMRGRLPMRSFNSYCNRV